MRGAGRSSVHRRVAQGDGHLRRAAAHDVSAETPCVKFHKPLNAMLRPDRFTVGPVWRDAYHSVAEAR